MIGLGSDKKCWIAETKIAEHVAHIVVSARRPICRAHILVWFALSRACDIWHLHMWLSTATTLVRKPETLSNCTAMLGDCFCEREERISAQNWGQLNFDGIVLPVDRKKRGLVLSICLQIADLMFRLINLHKFSMVQKKAWGQYVNLWLAIQQKGHTRSFFCPPISVLKGNLLSANLS